MWDLRGSHRSTLRLLQSHNSGLNQQPYCAVAKLAEAWIWHHWSRFGVRCSVPDPGLPRYPCRGKEPPHGDGRDRPTGGCWWDWVEAAYWEEGGVKYPAWWGGKSSRSRVEPALQAWHCQGGGQTHVSGCDPWKGGNRCRPLNCCTCWLLFHCFQNWLSYLYLPLSLSNCASERLYFNKHELFFSLFWVRVSLGNHQKWEEVLKGAGLGFTVMLGVGLVGEWAGLGLGFLIYFSTKISEESSHFSFFLFSFHVYCWLYAYMFV